MDTTALIDSFVFIEVSRENTQGQKKTFLYRGKLLKDESDSITIDNMMDGNDMIIAKKNIISIKKMSVFDVNTFMLRLQNVSNQLRINPDIKKDVDMLDKKLKKFQKRL